VPAESISVAGEKRRGTAGKRAGRFKDGTRSFVAGMCLCGAIATTVPL
jgi:hypothetical protein